MGTEACGMAKVGSGYPAELMTIRAAATKQKDWGKRGLMIVKSDKIIGDEDVLCMTWVNLNTVSHY